MKGKRNGSSNKKTKITNVKTWQASQPEAYSGHEQVYAARQEFLSSTQISPEKGR
jgi:hypothetical protein